MKTTTCRCGFTLIETMIVVAILAIMAALATPSYVQYRRYSIRSACVSNLKSLESAIEQIKLSGKEDVSMVDICEPVGRLKSEPRCPADKSQPYDISGPLPVCPNWKIDPVKYTGHTISE